VKKQVTIEQAICDFCQHEQSYQQCLRCGKDVCWACKKTRGVDYNHAVYFAGSGDGFYCTSCDIALSESKADPVHQAYVGIRALRDEQIAWGKDFEKRRDVAEETLRNALSQL